MTDDMTGTTRFETEIKPLFRERDREAMQFRFDLWSYDDVSQHAEAILTRLRDGTMPCDGAWPPAQIDPSNGGSRAEGQSEALTGRASERCGAWSRVHATRQG